jgi:hypothetical protein
MPYLALGLVALAAYLILTGGKRPVFKRREWRIASAGAALAAFTGGAYAGVRGEWPISIVLVVMGLWLASSARQVGARTARAPSSSKMSADEARRILGVGPEATKAEIQAAYTRLMRMAHPDAGGTAGLAAQLNAARDRLLGR